MSENHTIDAVITKVFDSFRKLSPALIALALTTGFILFVPNNILSKFGLNNLSEIARVIVGFVFLLSTLLILTILISSGANYLQKIHIRRKKIAECRMLNEEQKAIIREMLAADDRSAYLIATDGDTIFLLSKQIICRPTQTIDHQMMRRNIHKYCPQPWVIELWLKNPNLFA